MPLSGTVCDLAVLSLAGALMAWKGWGWIDPVVSLLFDGVPEGIDLDEVNHHLLALPGMVALHDLHAPCVPARRANALSI